MATSSRTNRRVRVVVRTRPTANFAHDMIQLEENKKMVGIHLPKNWDQVHGFINNQQQDWSFPVDKVLHNASQEEVYEECARGVVSRLLDGYNGTVMAYGETGAGKTYTMTGGMQTYRLRGVIPRAIAQVFQEVRERLESSITVRISFLELYNDTMYDLLSTLPGTSSTVTASNKGSTPALAISEDDRGCVSVKGLTVRLASNEEEALNMLFEGETNRTIAEHSLNKTSSRSHCIFTIHVESRSRTHSSAAYTVSKLNLVDLAGSERLSKTNSTGTTQREAMHINKSLSFLEQVTLALADSKRGHVPYRQSKLTHVLKDSLGGNCHTLMIANIWAEASQIEETISTLRFAQRMMCVTTEPQQNVIQDPRLLVRQYEQEIKALKQELAMHDTLANRGSVSYEPLSEGQVTEIQRQVHQFTEGTIPEIEIVNVRQIREVFAQFKELVVSLEKRVPVEEPEQPPTTVVEEKGGVTTTTPVKHGLKGAKGKAAVAPPPEAEKEKGEKLVGDTEGAGLGVGVAPSTLKHSASPVAASQKLKSVGRKASRQLKGNPLSSSSMESRPPSEANEQGLPQGSEGREEPRPSTPPSRPEAFEQFKKERGSEINKIFVVNKESLHRKKKEAMELSVSINELKRKIDQLHQSLEARREERRTRAVGELTTETGESIIEEQEYLDITQLKQLKAQYREQFDSLQALQREVQYCQQYVDQSRARLLSEFDTWYRLAFLGEKEGEESGEKKPPAVEYEHERFDRLQTALLKDDPATIAFYNAQLRTERRTYETSYKRKPGQVTSDVRNRPPGLMTFS